MTTFMNNCDIYSTWDVGAQGGNREDLLDIMVNIAPYETHFFTNLGKTVATAILHEHMIDSLEQPGDPDNPSVHCTPEASDARFDPITPPCRVNNLTHIFRKTYDISDTQQAVSQRGGTAGVHNMFVYQAMKALKELKMLIEFALLHSTRQIQVAPQYPGVCAGSSPGLCRMMDGIFAAIEWNTDDFSCLDSEKQGKTLNPEGSPYTALIAQYLTDLTQLMWADGADPKDIYVNAYQKRAISAMFYAGQTRNTPVESKRLSQVVDYIENDMSTMRVNLHRYIPTRRVLFTDNSFLRIAILRAVKAEILARVGNSRKGMVEGEMTLEVRAPASLGQIINLTNAAAEE